MSESKLGWVLGAAALAAGAWWVFRPNEDAGSAPKYPQLGQKRPSIIIKGSHVAFQLKNREGFLRLPVSYGIVHDADGVHFSRCQFFFGPFKKTAQPIDKTSKATAYMGRSYRAHAAIVDVPKGPWNPVGDVVQIFYKRRGGIQPVKFFHPFKLGVHPRLFKHGNFYKLELQSGCVADDRGFVFP